FHSSFIIPHSSFPVRPPSRSGYRHAQVDIKEQEMSNELQVALVSGPAYDPLYECLPEFARATGVKVGVAFSGDHPTLNHHLARRHNSPPDCYGFLFPGRESGLFGTFFELAEMAGARLFPETLVPDIENGGGRWALQLLRTFYAEGLVPPELTRWHYDKIHECFRAGRAAMVGDWPGYYGLYSDP